MWRKLPYSEPFFLSFTKDNGYFIYITDFTNIWWVYYKENDFLSVLKNSNEDLEMDNDDQLLQKGLKMLLQPENLKKIAIAFEEESLNISMTLSCGFPFYLDMKLKEGSKKMFFKNVTQELLKTIHDLRTSENELSSMLKKKDIHIDEYKKETDVRLPIYVITEVFSDEKHMGKHPKYANNFGSSEISECLLNKIVDETENQVVVKQENVQVDVSGLKVEPDTQQAFTNEPESMSGTERRLNSETIKREIKNEPYNNISPKKRLRKLLKI